MSPDPFVAALAKAAGRTTLKAGGTSLAPTFSVGPDAGQPMMVIVWETARPDDCRFILSPRLMAGTRIDFAADRLSGVWPLLEAFYAHSLRTRSPVAGRVNINLDDNPVLPGLAFCGKDGRTFLIPDSHFTRARGYAETRLFFANGGPPWRSRIPRAVWRGATTGNSATGWRGLPRIRLCEISRQHPHLLDARVTAVVQQPPGAEAEIAEAGLLSASIPVHSFGTWRTQIDIDGNTNSWPGLFQKLLTGSPVVKVASAEHWRQWYYDRLKPWETIVPVASDLSDLVEKLEWLRDHPEEAQAIGMAGRTLALSISYEAAIAGAVLTMIEAFKIGGTENPPSIPGARSHIRDLAG